MARQQGIIRFTGRLGNTVGYLAKDGKGNSFDASRVLAAQVTNPQTIAQMDQRMKMAPVINFYRGLRGILDHSWQTVKYGEPSRLFFYSQTLRNLSTAGVPYLNKGDKQFVPWAFPISSGSIPVVLSPVVFDSNNGRIEMSSSWGQNVSTLGDLSQWLESIAFGLKDGMQVTFVFVYNIAGSYVPRYERIILDAASEELLQSMLINTEYDEATDKNRIFLQKADGEPIEEEVVASGIIVSELVNNVWQRNNASLVISDSLRTLYNSQSAYDAMLASYRNTNNSRESDWYLNGGGDESSTTVATVREVTLETSTGTKTIAYYKVGGTKYAPYYTATLEQQLMACAYRKGGDMAFTKSQSMVIGSGGFVEDLQTEYLALGYTLCTRSELLAIAPDLTIPE